MKKRVTARVAHYISAINEARDAGWTWDELGSLFDASAETIRSAVRRCKYVADQRPLSDLTDKSSSVEKDAVVDQHKAGQPIVTERQPLVTERRPLPSDGSRVVDAGQSRRDELEKHNVVFK